MSPSQAKLVREIQRHLSVVTDLMAELNATASPGCCHPDGSRTEMTLMGAKTRSFFCRECRTTIETTALVGPSEVVDGTATWPPRSFG